MSGSYWERDGIRITSERKSYAKRKWEEYADSESRALLQNEVELPAMSYDEYEKLFSNAGKLETSASSFQLYIENDQGELVGWINVHTIDRKNGVFSYGIGIFKEHQKQGYGTRAVRMLLRYCFDELRLHKCNIECLDLNEGSLRLHTAIGFKEEGRRRESVYLHGAYHDEVLLGITDTEYRRASG
jgi:RimJ/RimL family protein N-acetyltransferase